EKVQKNKKNNNFPLDGTCFFFLPGDLFLRNVSESAKIRTVQYGTMFSEGNKDTYEKFVPGTRERELLKRAAVPQGF
ncbi:hypothetical protein, partial [Selenomonas bovis]|uniref:hypothetical protein n=1 Tax=Selenomonas bovis TaxID=416586 RepID=UPI003AB96307